MRLQDSCCSLMSGSLRVTEMAGVVILRPHRWLSPSHPRRKDHNNVACLPLLSSRALVLLCRSPPSLPPRLSALERRAAMEGHLEFRDWEILMVPDAGEDDWKPSQEHYSGDGAIVYDYFALDSREESRKGASFDANGHDEEMVEAAAMVDSKTPSLADPDTEEKDVGFPEASTDSDGCGFDEPEEEKRSCLGSQKGELGGAKAPEIVEKIHEDEEGEEVVGTMKMGIEKPEEEGCEEHVEIEDIGLQNDLVKGREKKVMAWWKLPFELLKFCAFRVKPVWSISLATAILGLWMLRKKLHKMKHRSRSIPLKIALDVKKPFQSQLKIQAVRLNEAFSVVRRLSILKSQLPAGGLTSWSVLTL